MMTSKYGLRLIISTIALLLLSEQVSAIGVAKTMVGTTVATTPAPNTMFLLDSGSVDYTPTSSLSNANSGYICQAVNTAAGCVGRMNTYRTCGKGYVPYISLTLSKTLGSSTDATQTNAVCPSQFWAHYTTTNPQTTLAYSGYEFQFQNTQAASNGSNAGSSVAFHWEIYCVPGSYSNATSSPNHWTYNNCSDATANTSNGGACAGVAPTSGIGACSTSGAPTVPFTHDLQPMLLDSGVTDLQGQSQYYMLTTNANRRCPSGYTPTITLSANKAVLTGTSASSTANSFAVCAFNNVYDGWQFESGVSNNYQVKLNLPVTPNGANAGINWSIYCYPPGVTLPTNDSACHLTALTQKATSVLYTNTAYNTPMAINPNNTSYLYWNGPGISSQQTVSIGPGTYTFTVDWTLQDDLCKSCGQQWSNWTGYLWVYNGSSWVQCATGNTSSKGGGSDGDWTQYVQSGSAQCVISVGNNAAWNFYLNCTGNGDWSQYYHVVDAHVSITSQ